MTLAVVRGWGQSRMEVHGLGADDKMFAIDRLPVNDKV